MKYAVSLAVALAAFGAVPAVAQDDSGDAASEAQVDPNKVTCERRAITGSRARRQRVCMTNAQWDELRRTGNRDVRDLVDESTRIGVGPTGGN